MGITQTLHRALQQHRRSHATYCGERARRWEEVGERVARLAAAFRALGIARGDRIALLALNCDRYLEMYLAVAWAGAVIVPLNTRWSVVENAYALNDSGATALCIDDAFTGMDETLRGQVGCLRAVIHCGDGPTPQGMIGYESLIASGRPMPDTGCTGEELAGIFYTGGTTGFPKGVMLSHRSLWASAAAILPVVPAADMSMVYLHAAPMFHAADFCGSMMTLLAGGAHVMMPAFRPAEMAAMLSRFGVTHVVLVPTMLHMLVTQPNWDPARAESLRCVLYGGSPMPEATLRAALAALPRSEFLQVYGQTELSPITTALLPEHHVLDGPYSHRTASAGRTLHCCVTQIVDANDAPVPIGVVGELRVRGPNTMLGYWNKPEETAATLRDGWVYTGDAARLDEDGFVYIVDRIKDMVVSGGENIYTAEVESACASHPGVLQCAVVGIPDERWGEAVHAVVVPRPGIMLSAEDLIAHCHGRIASYKCPRSVEFRADSLPLSGAGKVLKRTLREPYWAGRSRRVN